MSATTIQTARPAKGISRFFPIVTWLPNYQRTWLRGDLIAGLTILALLIPEGMAYAELAGLPPQTAFYAAPIGLLLYTIFGTSRQLMVAVSAAIATMSAVAVAPLAAAGSPEYAALSAALVAMILGIGVSLVFGLEARGVHVVGVIPAGFVPPKIPAVTLQDAWLLLPGALGIALVNFAEAYGPARGFASKHKYEIDANQELIGLGQPTWALDSFKVFRSDRVSRSRRPTIERGPKRLCRCSSVLR